MQPLQMPGSQIRKKMQTGARNVWSDEMDQVVEAAACTQPA
jgi:hypothetical protein